MVLGLAVACGDSRTCAGFPKPTAGSGVAWVVLVRTTHPALSIDSATNSTRVLGTFVVDAGRLTAEYRDDLDLWTGGYVTDGRGNSFDAEYFRGTGEAGDYEERIVRYGRDGGPKAIGEPESGRLSCLSVAVASGRTRVFYLRGRWMRSGTLAVRGIDVEENRPLEMPMPPIENGTADDWVWDHLMASSLDEVVLVGRFWVDGDWNYRTWRGNISTGAWDVAVEGAFQPLDAEGTLVEIRDRCDRPSEFAMTDIEWIEGGHRRIHHLGYAGETTPVFGTRYLAWWDPRTEELVLHSLVDGSERRLGQR